MSARKGKARRRPGAPPRARERFRELCRPDIRGESTDPKTLTTPRGRVWYIARLMAAGAWKRGRSDRELAELWGLERTSVRKLSAEASRLLEHTVNDRNQLLKLMQTRLVEIADQDGPDRVQALRTLYEHLGELRQRQELSGPGGAPIETKGVAQIVILPAKEWLDDAAGEPGADAPNRGGHNGNGSGPDD